MKKQIFMSLLWVFLCISGVVALNLYSGVAGDSSDSINRWPTQSTIQGKFPKLLLFLHPHCECSSATVHELARLLPHLGTRAEITAIFVKPKGKEGDWVYSSLWHETKNLPNVKVLVDQDLQETKLFDAKTSGQVLLFGEDKKLLFSGGMTQARGHEGDSLGRDILLSWIYQNKVVSNQQSSQVFGCHLDGNKQSLENDP